MTQAVRSRTGRVASPGGIVAAGLGLVLFVYVVREAGLSEVVAGIRQIGWGFLVVLGLTGLRFAARALAWIRCVDAPGRLDLWRAFQATVAGDALGNLTLLGPFVSEPTKTIFVRDRLPVAVTLPALGVENLFYTMSVALVFVGGLIGLFVRLDAPLAWWMAVGGGVALLVVILVSAHGVVWRRRPLANAVLDWTTRRWKTARWVERLRSFESRVHEAYPRSRDALVPLAILEGSFHVSAVAEVYLALTLINGVAPPLLDAFLLESANRLITVAFKFVPLRIGVDEAGTGLLADVLALGTTAGVTLAIVRKARMVCWLGVGVVSLARRGLTVRRILADAEAASNAGDGGSGASRDRTLAIAVMARSPVASIDTIKTRLKPAIDDDRLRARLYGAFLADTVRTCRDVPATLRVAYTPDGGRDGFAAAGIEPFELIPQRGADLGEREHNLLVDLFRAGFDAAIIIGSDLPTLPAEHLMEAARALEATEQVVIGPSQDGGYYLIALRARVAGHVPDLFSGVRWSTASALDDTVAAAHRLGLEVTFVPRWYDVDDAADLARLMDDLRPAPHAHRAPATAAVLRELFGPDAPRPAARPDS